MKISNLGEFGLIERIRRTAARDAKRVLVGIGDDAAALALAPASPLLATTDMLLEGVHFDLGTTDLSSLGWKSAAVNLSDIAAMGGTPRFCLKSLGLPASLTAEGVAELYRGLKACLKRYRTALAGGDDAGGDLAERADEMVEEAASYSTPIFPPAEPDWAGLGRDTAYLIGYQFIGFLILYVAPECISNWSQEDKEHYDFRKWMHNVTHPNWDEDKWWTNYILHPYWGPAYYLVARGRGFGRWGSFWYSFLASKLYEFGTEAFAEQVSIQDFFVTHGRLGDRDDPRGAVAQAGAQGGVPQRRRGPKRESCCIRTSRCASSGGGSMTTP